MTSPLSRRRFLRNGTFSVAAAAAAVTAIPGLPSLLGDADADGGAGAGAAAAATSAGEAAPALDETASMDSPVTAHISDLSGEMRLFVENRTITVTDPALVARILAAAR